MGIPGGFAAYAAGEADGRGERAWGAAAIVFCQYWKSNAIRDSLNLARAYPGVRSSAGTVLRFLWERAIYSAPSGVGQEKSPSRGLNRWIPKAL
jgi:hypothetical protein